MKEVRDFTDKELAAIKELEKAFAVCARLGLSFVGMDDSINCFHNDVILSDDRPAMWEIKDTRQPYKMIKAKTYIDSGGW